MESIQATKNTIEILRTETMKEFQNNFHVPETQMFSCLCKINAKNRNNFIVIILRFQFDKQYNKVKNIGSGANQSGFKSWLIYLGNLITL